jgi:hypothetical protein
MSSKTFYLQTFVWLGVVAAANVILSGDKRVIDAHVSLSDLKF